MSFNEPNSFVQSCVSDLAEEKDTSLQWDYSPEQYQLEDSEDHSSDLFEEIYTSTPLSLEQTSRTRSQANKQPIYDDTVCRQHTNLRG